MKTFIFSLCLVIGAPAFAKTVVATVNGMVCGFCAQGIKKKFSQEKAVKSVDVDLEQHLVKIDLKDNESLSDEVITQNLKDAGYSVKKIERP